MLMLIVTFSMHELYELVISVRVHLGVNIPQSLGGDCSNSGNMYFL